VCKEKATSTVFLFDLSKPEDILVEDEREGCGFFHS
jgi:hypothetical protein